MVIGRLPHTTFEIGGCLAHQVAVGFFYGLLVTSELWEKVGILEDQLQMKCIFFPRGHDTKRSLKAFRC